MQRCRCCILRNATLRMRVAPRDAAVAVTTIMSPSLQLGLQMKKRVLRLGLWGMTIFWNSVAVSQTGLSLAQLQPVDFGVMPAVPSRCSMSSNSLLTGDCVGTGIPGKIEVTGEPYYAYNVSVSSVGWVDNIMFRPSLNAKKFSLNAQGRGTFSVTGELRFKTPDPKTGTFVLTYLISVNYQ